MQQDKNRYKNGGKKIDFKLFSRLLKEGGVIVESNWSIRHCDDWHGKLDYGKSLIESWGTAFLPDRQSPLIFV